MGPEVRAGSIEANDKCRLLPEACEQRVSKMATRAERNHPSAAKAAKMQVRYGTAEAVPLQAIFEARGRFSWSLVPLFPWSLLFNTAAGQSDRGTPCWSAGCRPPPRSWQA